MSKHESSDDTPVQPRETVCSLAKKHSAASASLAFLTFVAVSKTLLTKLVFTHSPTPVAFSILSCVATNLCIAPVLIYQGNFRMLTKKELPGFALVCLAMAIDLGCTNVALAILSVALQQCIKATSPAATVFVESLFRGKTNHKLIYATVIGICVGPILVVAGGSSKKWNAKSPSGSQLFGMIMMLSAVVGGAFKYVLAHKAIKEYRESMGVLAFTFWVEIFIALMLLPWAILNGEAAVFLAEHRTLGEATLLWFTAAYGGVRIISQFLFLAHTSATSLAMSNLATQALTIIIGMVAFGTEATPMLLLGVAVTLVMSAVYAWLKTSSVLQTAAVIAKSNAPRSAARKTTQLEVAGLNRAEDSAAAV